MNYKNKLKKLFELNNTGDVQIESLEKYIDHVIKIKTFSRKYNFNTRYLEQSDSLPSRWSKSWFRDTFAKSGGETAELPFIKVDHSFFRNDKDFVLFLDENPRISAEISHGSLDYKKLSTLIENYKDSFIKINEGIVIPHISTYNIWHHFVELISIANEIANNKNLKLNHFIFIPEMEDTKELINLLSIQDRVKTYPIEKNIIIKNSYIVTGVYDEILPTQCVKNTIKTIVENSKIKQNKYAINSIFLSRGDKMLNRRNITNENDLILTLKKKFSDLEINKPGYGNLKDNISKMINAKYVISPQGTQLYFNCLFMKEPRLIWELVSDNYYGLTVGELAANFLNCEFMSSPTKNIEPGYPIYKDQVVDIKALELILNKLKIN